MVEEYKRQLAEIRHRQEQYKKQGAYDSAERLEQYALNLEYAIKEMGG